MSEAVKNWVKVRKWFQNLKAHFFYGKEKEAFDYEELKKKDPWEISLGQSLFVKLVPSFVNDISEEALQAEMEEHLDDEQRFKVNRKNELSSKELKMTQDILNLST